MRTTNVNSANNVGVYPITNGIIGAVAATSSYGNGAAGIIQLPHGASWSPVLLDDRIVVVGSPVNLVGGGIASIVIYQFNRLANTLTVIASRIQGASMPPNANGFFSVDWSADASLLTYGGDVGTQPPFSQLFISSVTPPTLTIMANTIWQSAELINWVEYSPNNKLIAVTGGSGSVASGKTLSLYTSGIQAIRGQINMNNIVANNFVYCTNALQQACLISGVGIFANSSLNVIISNTAFNNDVNYQLVSNVYMGGLNGTPGLLQNISIPPR